MANAEDGFVLWEELVDDMRGHDNEERTPVQLPEPWVDEPLDTDTAEALDKLSLVWGVLTNDRKENYNIVGDDGDTYNVLDLPNLYGEIREARPFDASGTWKVVRNTRNGMRVALLLQEKLDLRSRPPKLTGEYQVKRMVVTSPAKTRDITSTDLRNLPLRAITSAYGRAVLNRTIAQNRWLNLADPEYKGIPEKYWNETGGHGCALPPANILDPLPAQYSRRPWFYALVAEQYDALEREHPDANISNLMVELNSSVAAGSVRRWITRARKECLLKPADWKRGPVDAA
ncbi:MAG: hypothetical protein SO032_07365 [Bifidobacterium pseudolongum]|nr:hypothetical protein [Bifidobacterium pseudolongum]